MTRGQKKHSKRIRDWFTSNHKPKYEKGQIEHGGNLFDVPTLDVIEMLGEEILDFGSYFVTLKDQVEDLIWVIRRLKAQNDYKDGEIEQLKLKIAFLEGKL